MGPDVANNISKSAPDFCTVYVISKGKILSVRSATRTVPKTLIHHTSHNDTLLNTVGSNDSPHMFAAAGGFFKRDMSPSAASKSNDETEIMFRSPFTRGRASNGRSYGQISTPESDISFVGSSRPSTGRMSTDQTSSDYGSFDVIELKSGPRLSMGSDSTCSDRRSIDLNSFISSSNCSGLSIPSFGSVDVESEMQRLQLQLTQTMDVYNSACKEALIAKQKALDLQKTKKKENQRLEDVHLADETTMAPSETEKAKHKAAFDAAEATKKIAELNTQKGLITEMKGHKDSQHDPFFTRYRKYSIEEIITATNNFSAAQKIGEGGYGPVYRGTLDHTAVAIKVLRPDATQGQSQFHQEVEILSCIRHPNMVLLLGACPEYGCLIYEFMSRGSLENHLFCKRNTPPLPWQLRFRMAAEIATGLLFLHQTKPEPLVHRDLKPDNILIDRNYVSKISDVGLARLVPASVVDSVTQYRMTQTAGTFFYIDPEYQQTGMLGTKSDIYSLGVLLLQMITAKPPMGLTHHVERAIETGALREVLDPAIQDWPYEETLKFAKLSLKCTELRKKDRPDLATVILPELERSRDFAEESMSAFMFVPMPGNTKQRSIPHDEICESQSMQSGISMASSSSMNPSTAEM